jgi:hypothetical protein
MNSIDSPQTVHLYLPPPLVSTPLAQPRVLIDTTELCIITVIIVLLIIDLLIPHIALALQATFVTVLLVLYLVHRLQISPQVFEGTTT